MSTPCSTKDASSSHYYSWETDCFPAKTPQQANWISDASSAVKPSPSMKLTLFDQSARKMGPAQRLDVSQRTPGTGYHSTAKRNPDQGRSVTKPRSFGKFGARLREDQENDLCRAFGAAVRVPEEPQAVPRGTAEKPNKPQQSQPCDQPPSTPTMVDSIRRFDFMKRALEESARKDANAKNQQLNTQQAKPAACQQGGGVGHTHSHQQQQQQEQLGRTDMYAAVRTNKATREELGGAKALTPVRRSARKPRKSEKEDEGCSLLGHDQDEVAALLESTNYCYTPNKELTPLLFGAHECEGGSKAKPGTESRQLRF